MTLSSMLKTSTSTLVRGAIGVATGLALFLAIAGTPGDALAQTTPASDGPALWVIKDSDSTLYLFGSVHVLRPETTWASPRVDAAFDSASTIWFEISNPDDQAALMPLIQQHGLSPDRPLSSLLTAEEVAQLDVAAGAIGGNAAQLDPMRPWLAALSLSVAPLVKAGYDPTSGVEMALMARAKAAGKPIDAFETVDKQVSILAGLPEDIQLAFLRETLKDFDEAVTLLDGMVEAWAKGDVEALDELVVEDMKADSPALYQTLLVDRNTDWANQIQTILEGSGTGFIAVGAAHLAGEDSVQAILEQRGVEVDRVQD